ncbi:hypothetical protein Nmel_011734 [Mimus melanotis]
MGLRSLGVAPSAYWFILVPCQSTPGNTGRHLQPGRTSRPSWPSPGPC